jgi:putative endonuclease
MDNGNTSLARRTRARGRIGEDRAVAWYQAHGYQLLARNWWCREGELDIVAKRGPLYVFCEVKARADAAFGLPVEAVGHFKQVRVRRAAARWFAAAGEQGRAGGGPVRFDVACVLGDVIEVIEGAF